ncbi:unnamed protein product [Cylicocyclus nassatus]|uniref:Uncharacterized protein n=1 Tax=Cylicocyclus nassatus TaxID=53992 RepID=A0AA36GFA3_CYLNA|nr:unnamed protein product [Cylicocyclus nassatus]
MTEEEQLTLIAALAFAGYIYKKYSAYKKATEEEKQAKLIDKAVNWAELNRGIEKLHYYSEKLKAYDNALLNLDLSYYNNSHDEREQPLLGVTLGKAKIKTQTGNNETEVEIDIGDGMEDNTESMKTMIQANREKCRIRLLEVYEETYSNAVTKTVTKTLSPAKKSIFGEGIEEALEIELENAKEQGEYHSNHEAYAILKEEIEEADIELARMRNFFEMAWGEIRSDWDDERIRNRIEEVKFYAILAAQELIQVAACAKKWLELIDLEEKEK